MTDCGDNTMRDLLPLLAHDALAADEVARVREHAASCASCTRDLELLGAAGRIFADATPDVDLAGILRRIPAAPVSRPALRVERRTDRRFAMPRYAFAAAASLVLVGALSLGALRTVFNGSSSVGGGGTIVVDSEVSGPSIPVEMLGAGGLSELGSDELRTLLAELEAMEVTVSADPATNRVPVTSMPEGI